MTAARTLGAVSATVAIAKLELRLTLADFNNPDSRRIDFLALITRESTGDILWNRDGSRFGGTETLDDGEIAYGPNEQPITRIRHNSATRVSFNDDAGEDIGAYFTTNARDLEVAFQTIDGFVAFSVQNNIAASGGNRVLFSIPNDLNTLLADIEVTDHFLVAVSPSLPCSMRYRQRSVLTLHPPPPPCRNGNHPAVWWQLPAP